MDVPVVISHPGMSMGFDREFYMQSAGFVEFTLSFALILTPLVRRVAAIILSAMFIVAVPAFGKIDAIGHAPIIAVMLGIIADDAVSRRRSICGLASRKILPSSNGDLGLGYRPDPGGLLRCSRRVPGILLRAAFRALRNAHRLKAWPKGLA